MSFKLRYIAMGCVTVCTLLLSCLDPYQPPSLGKDVNFLVVDGYINATDSLAIVKLSRAIKLNNVSDFPLVTNASVIIENENGYLATLSSSSPGVYTIKRFFSFDHQYRLRITIADNEYYSDLISLQKNSPIDSLGWKAFDDKLEIYASTHDFSEGKKYYRYSYDETYEYNSYFYSNWNLIGGTAVPRPTSDQIYSCWVTKASTDINLATTEIFTQNIIANHILLRVQRGDRKLWRKISLLAKQISLSKEAYDYWIQIQKISESLGGLFDPLPYSIKGNIASIDDPDEVVLGYFSGGEVSRSRIVIRNNQLPSNFGGTLQSDCREQFIESGSVNTLQDDNILLTRAEYMGGVILVGYYYSLPRCVDCRLEGGSSDQPEFMK